MSRAPATSDRPGPARAIPRWRRRAVAVAALALPAAALAGGSGAPAAAGAAPGPGYPVTATIHVGKGPFGMAVNPFTHRLYVTNRGSGTVSVINTATNKVTATIGVGNHCL
jgi:YVTN family beta-propeller protein